MSNKKKIVKTKRISVGMDDDLYSILDDYSNFTKQTRSDAVYSLLDELRPVLKTILSEIEDFKKKIDQGADLQTQQDLFVGKMFRAVLDSKIVG